MKQTLIIFITLVIGIVFGLLLSTAHELIDQRYEYVIEATRELLRQPASERESFLKNSPIFSSVSVLPDHSEEGNHSYYFYPAKAGSDVSPRFVVPNQLRSGRDFHGYYIVLSGDGHLIDFGFYKP